MHTNRKVHVTLMVVGVITDLSIGNHETEMTRPRSVFTVKPNNSSSASISTKMSGGWNTIESDAVGALLMLRLRASYY